MVVTPSPVSPQGLLRRLAAGSTFALLVPGFALALTPPAFLCDDTTWRTSDSPVTVTAGFVLGGRDFCPGSPTPTLTIEPGVEVRFAQSKGLDLYGTLVARGTPQAPIRFTSDQATPAPGDWLGIRFRDTADDATFDGSGNYLAGSVLEHCIIEYAKNAGASTGVIATDSSAPFLASITVQHCNPTGAAVIAMSIGSAAVRMRDVEVTGNTCATGISISGSGGVDLVGLSVTGSTVSVRGLSLSGSGGGRVSGATIANNLGNGGGAYVARPVTIDDATISGNGGPGLQGYGFTLVQSTVSGNGGAGVLLSGSATSIATSRISGNNGVGIQASLPFTLSDSCIHGNQGGGLLLSGGSIRRTTIVNSSDDAVTASGSGTIDMQETNLVQNATAGAYTIRNQRSSTSSAVIATNNWWGTTDPGVIEAGVFHCLDDVSKGCVTLTSPAAGPIPGAPDIEECAASVPPPSTTTSSPTSSTSTTTTSTRPPSSTTTSTASTSSTSSTSTSTATLPTTTSVSTTSSTSRTIPTSTSTALPSSTTAPTTTSTSSSLGPTSSTSSTVSTSSSTAPTASLPATTSTSTSSTTSLPPGCGDGIVTAPELCDPSAPGFAGCCDATTCLPYAVGKTCGLERDGCQAPVCDGQGRCVTRPALVGASCRGPGAIGPCDPGAECTTEPFCPETDTVSGCEAVRFALNDTGAKLKLLCRAKRSARVPGPVRCDAALFGDASAAALGKRAWSARARRELTAVPASDCAGPQFSTTAPKKLAARSRSDLARAILARVNKTDRRFLAPGKTICVRVTFTAGGTYTQTRLYNVTVPY